MHRPASGNTLARELAREGVDVAIVARNKGDLEATARELAAETNRRIVPLTADVTSKEQVDGMIVEATQQLSGLHILVNSGSAPGGSATATGPIETVIDEDLLQDFNTKYVGALRCSRAIIPFMKSAGWAASSTSAAAMPATPVTSAAAPAMPPWCT
jgi:NAD(P)-dependent dehydrogenase (short-subunit alcohol dehydrogenase family)